ncbi:MAG: CDP-glycerol glycerophosphotransferase family protein [Sphaerochaeta sp.]|nr:CDP-glycerol glycerophosphotransferase family protein [Sphaerochaeta sp.]
MRTLLLSGGPTTIPLIRPLSESYNLVSILGHNVRNFKEITGVDVEPIEMFELPGMRDFAWNEATKVIKQMNWRNVKVGHKQEQWFWGWLLKQFVVQITMHELISVCKEQRDIAGYVTHEDVGMVYKMIARWCKQQGIPSLQVCHSPYGIPNDDQGVHNELNTDFVACSGPLQKGFFESQGYAPERSRITGLPHLDYLNIIGKDKGMARAQLRLDEKKPTILFVGTWLMDSERDRTIPRCENIFNATLDAVKKHDWNLVVKVHPAAEQNQRDLTVKWHADRAKAKEVHAVVTARHNDVVLAASDCAIGEASSSFLTEAAIYGIPAAEWLDGYYGYSWPLALRYKAETIVEDVDGVLVNMLRPEWMVENEDSRNKHIYEYNYLCDGNASRRVKEWVDEICASKSSGKA